MENEQNAGLLTKAIKIMLLYYGQPMNGIMAKIWAKELGAKYSANDIKIAINKHIAENPVHQIPSIAQIRDICNSLNSQKEATAPAVPNFDINAENAKAVEKLQRDLIKSTAPKLPFAKA
jgi:hypothetical protein